METAPSTTTTTSSTTVAVASPFPSSSSITTTTTSNTRTSGSGSSSSESSSTDVEGGSEVVGGGEHGLKLVFRLQDSVRDDVVERALLKRGWSRFELLEADGVTPVPLGTNQDLAPEGVGVNSPTIEYNLHFKRGRFVKTEFEKATVPSAPNRLRINHFQKSNLITHKGKLLRLMKKLLALHGSIFDFAPEGYILPSEYTKFIKAYSKYQPEKACWIVKPQDQSQGQGISLVRDLSDLKYDCESVIQRYVDRPLLIGGYKFDLRLYVLVSRAHPLEVWLFNDGIVRFSTEKYIHPSADGFETTQLLGHLTNASIHKNTSAYEQDKDVIGKGSKWDFKQWQQWFKDQNRPLAYHVVWERIKTVVRLTTLPLLSVLPPSPVPFEVLGFDVMVDESLKPWLIETNAAPALGLESAVDQRVKPALINDMVEVLDFRSMMRSANEYETREAQRQAVFSQAHNASNDGTVPDGSRSSNPSKQKDEAVNDDPCSANTNSGPRRSQSKRRVDTTRQPPRSTTGIGVASAAAAAVIPGQVLSPQTAANHVLSSSAASQGRGRRLTDRNAKKTTKGGCSGGSGRGGYRRGTGGGHNASSRGGNERKTVGASSGGTNRASRAGIPDHKKNGSQRRKSGKHATSSTASSLSSSTTPLEEMAISAAANEWGSMRKQAGGFELVFPFSPATLALSRTTAAMYGKPVELDAVLKRSFALVRTHHKGCTSRARESFERFERNRGNDEAKSETKPGVQSDEQTAIANHGRPAAAVPSSGEPNNNESDSEEAAAPKAGDHDAQVTASPNLEGAQVDDDAGGSSGEPAPRRTGVADTECLADVSEVVAECGVSVSEAGSVEREVIAAVEDVISTAASSVEETRTPATATAMKVASDRNARDEPTGDH